MKPTSLCLLLSATLTIAAGCRSAPVLKPSDKADKVHWWSTDQVASASDSNIELVTTGNAWEGTATISVAVTPLHIALRNHGDEDIAVTLDRIALVDEKGRTFASLPPAQTEGLVPADGTQYHPHYPAQNFSFAPYYQSVAGMKVYRGAWGPGPAMGTVPIATHGHWDRAHLPTTEMINRALPEGVLEPGGEVMGFVYFEKVALDAEDIRLVVEFLGPGGRKVVSSITVPLRVGT